MMKISQDQARALALVINGIRPDWDAAGIYTAIGRAKDMGDIAEVALAAIKAAQLETNRTPAVIAMQGPHWSSPSATVKLTAESCPIHDVRPAHNCHCCRSEWLVSGSWPEGTLHHQAERRGDDSEPDARTRAAGSDR